MRFIRRESLLWDVLYFNHIMMLTHAYQILGIQHHCSITNRLTPHTI